MFLHLPSHEHHNEYCLQPAHTLTWGMFIIQMQQMGPFQNGESITFLRIPLPGAISCTDYKDDVKDNNSNISIF